MDSDNESTHDSRYEEYMEKERRLDEQEERAEREKMFAPHFIKTKKEKMKYYEWLDDCERSPGFAPSYYEFQENIEKSRRKRQEKKLREKNTANPPPPTNNK